MPLFLLYRSIAVNTKHASRLHFHIVYLRGNADVAVLTRMLACNDLFRGCNGVPKVDLHELDGDMINAPMSAYGEEKHATRLISPSNYARLYFHRILPEIDKIVYIDLDTIVKGDIVRLWDETDLHGMVIAACSDDNFLSKWISSTTNLPSLFFSRYYAHINLETLGLNNGLRKVQSMHSGALSHSRSLTSCSMATGLLWTASGIHSGMACLSRSSRTIGSIAWVRQS